MTCLMLAVLLGAWELTIPIEGLNDGNRSALEEVVRRHFAKMKNDEGGPMLVQVSTKGDLATFTFDCPVAEVRLATLRAALAGSPFGIDLVKGKSGHWMVHGCVAFRWQSQDALDPDEKKQLEATLREIGTGTKSVEATSTAAGKGFENRLILTFGETQSAPAYKIIKVLEMMGHRDIDLVWTREPYASRGARRYAAKGG